MNVDLRAGPVIGIDETRVQVMKEPGKADTTQSYMWVCRGGPPEKTILQFHYSPNRSSKTAQMLLKNFSGYVVSDGYKGYDYLNATAPGQPLKHAVCWAHARRRFYDADKASKKAVRPKMIIKLIGKLYQVEKTGRTQELSSEELHALRMEKSAPVVEEIFEQIEKKSLQVNPAGLTGKAIAYALKFKKQLKMFLTDGTIPIDNNPVENAIRLFVVGRKNWLFSGSPRGAQASAGLYSLIETTRAASLNTYWYLRWLFEKLPVTPEEDYANLLPYNIGTEVLYEAFHEMIDVGQRES